MSYQLDMILKGFDHREVERVHMSMADFLCWAQGFTAALHEDELSRRGIFGLESVRRGRELLQRLVVIDGPVPQAKSAEPEGLWITDPRELDVLAMLRVGIEQRVTGDGARAGDEIHIVIRPNGPAALMDPRGPVMPAQGIVGWMVEKPDGELRDPYLPGRRLFCRREKALDWNNRHPGWSQPVPVYGDPALPGEPVGWVSNPDGPGFIMRATAAEVSDQVGGADDWCTPYPVYAQPQPALAADWPRAISDPMARAYGETLRLALQAGNDEVGAARAVLGEFMLSHRPAAADFPPTITIEQAESLAETLTHALREGDDHPQATKRLIDEFLRARNTEMYPPPAAPSARLPKGFVIMPAEMTSEQGTAADREADKLVRNETADDRNRRAYRALVAARPPVDFPPTRAVVVEADFAEVPTAYRLRLSSGVAVFFTPDEHNTARDQAKAAGSDLVPLYAAPHPAVLPTGWIGAPDRPTRAMVMGATAARRVVVEDAPEAETAWANRLYDAFMVNRPRMPG